MITLDRLNFIIKGMNLFLNLAIKILLCILYLNYFLTNCKNIQTPKKIYNKNSQKSSKTAKPVKLYRHQKTQKLKLINIYI